MISHIQFGVRPLWFSALLLLLLLGIASLHYYELKSYHCKMYDPQIVSASMKLCSTGYFDYVQCQRQIVSASMKLCSTGYFDYVQCQRGAYGFICTEILHQCTLSMNISEVNLAPRV